MYYHLDVNMYLAHTHNDKWNASVQRISENNHNTSALGEDTESS